MEKHLSELEKFEQLPTKNIAPHLGIQGQTMRRAYCVDGHYLGVVPTKLPNRRLLWPTEPFRRILEGR